MIVEKILVSIAAVFFVAALLYTFLKSPLGQVTTVADHSADSVRVPAGAKFAITNKGDRLLTIYHGDGTVWFLQPGMSMISGGDDEPEEKKP